MLNTLSGFDRDHPLGGGFQTYYNPTRSGYIVPEIIERMGEVADFCRARQEVSHRSSTVPQVALLLSAETQFDRSDAVFTWYGCTDELEGALHALVENRYSVDVLAEHQLQPRLAEFPLVVVPDSYKLADDFRAALVKYVEDGGSLLLLGERRTMTDFVPPVGPVTIRLRAPTRPTSVRWVPESAAVAWSWDAGVLCATASSVAIHGVLVVD